MSGGIGGIERETRAGGSGVATRAEVGGDPWPRANVYLNPKSQSRVFFVKKQVIGIASFYKVILKTLLFLGGVVCLGLGFFILNYNLLVRRGG